MSVRAAWVLGLGVALFSGAMFAQETTVAPAFEVASIKQAPPLSPQLLRAGQLHLGINVRGTRADFGYMSLADLIPYAYRVKPHQVAGPDWMRETRWDILAKVPEGESEDRAPEMMQALLKERFKLSVHRENREHPVYELVVAKTGLKIKPSTAEEETVPATGGAAGENVSVPGFFLGGGVTAGASNIRVNSDGRGVVVSGGPNGTTRISPSPNGGGMRLEMTRVTMAAFAEMLTPFTDRTVIDSTELKGAYEVALSLPMEAMLNMAQNAARSAGIAIPNGAIAAGRLGGAGALGAASDPSGTSIFQAVEELGLRLQPRKAPIETIVVDHLERTPTEN